RGADMVARDQLVSGQKVQMVLRPLDGHSFFLLGEHRISPHHQKQGSKKKRALPDHVVYPPRLDESCLPEVLILLCCKLPAITILGVDTKARHKCRANALGRSFPSSLGTPPRILT